MHFKKRATTGNTFICHSPASARKETLILIETLNIITEAVMVKNTEESTGIIMISINQDK